MDGTGMIALVALLVPLLAASAQTMPATVPATQPAQTNQKAQAMDRVDVEVPLLRPLNELKGMQWPTGYRRQPYSWGIQKPCNLTVVLPSGKRLTMRTRPVLIVGRIMYSDYIESVDAPPEGGKGSLPELVTLIEGLLRDWQLEPDENMRAELNHWRKADYKGLGVGGRMRARMPLDEQTHVAFRVDSGGPSLGGWYLVVEFSGNDPALTRIADEAWAKQWSPTTGPASSASKK